MLWSWSNTPLDPWCGDTKWFSKGSIDGGSPGERLDRPKRIRIIVIDDESLIAETLVEILKHEGFDAMSASSGDSAVELAQECNPDIVLSDVIMPGLDGIETGIRIREINPTCKVILFSGQAATVDLVERTRKQGHSFDILAKPIKPEQLLSIIRGMVRQKPS